MRTVVIESPLAGDYQRNRAYAMLAMLDCLHRGEAPFASHLLYPLVLDDTNPTERKIGMKAGLLMGSQLDAVVVYTDLGLSTGIQSAITRHTNKGKVIEYRTIEGFERKIDIMVSTGRVEKSPTIDDTLVLAPKLTPPPGARNVAEIRPQVVAQLQKSYVAGDTLPRATQAELDEARNVATILVSNESVTEPEVAGLHRLVEAEVDDDFDEPAGSAKPFRLGSK